MKKAAATHLTVKMVTDKVPSNIKHRLPAGPLAQRNFITSELQECLIQCPKTAICYANK